MLFPSIKYKIIPSCGSIAGIMPSSLMVSKSSVHEFVPVDHYISSTLTNPGTTASNNIKYIAC